MIYIAYDIRFLLYDLKKIILLSFDKYDFTKYFKNSLIIQDWKSVNEVDFVFIFHWLEDLRYPYKTLEYISKHLRKNSYILILFFNIHHFFFLIYLLISNRESNFSGLYTLYLLNFLTLENIKKFFSSPEYEVKLVKRIFYPIPEIYFSILKTIFSILRKYINDSFLQKYEEISYIILVKKK